MQVTTNVYSSDLHLVHYACTHTQTVYMYTVCMCACIVDHMQAGRINISRYLHSVSNLLCSFYTQLF